MTVPFPERLQLAQRPTPLQLLPRLTEKLAGPRIWVKRDDLTGAAVSGNKVRKLEFVLADAIARGFDTIITIGGVQSNHCRATALLCAQLGLACHLILRGDEPAVPDGNLLLDKLAGAAISYYRHRDYNSDSHQIHQQWVDYYARQGRRALVVPIGASNGVGIWGYIGCAVELKQDFEDAGIDPAAIMMATGSGGTQAGLTVGTALCDIRARVIGVNVCDDAAYFQRKVREDIAEWQQRYQSLAEVAAFRFDPQRVEVLEGYVGPGYGVAGPEVFETIALLARCEGLVLDPVYSGKAFTALIKQVEAGCFSSARDVVFVHTGGIFGLFPQREQCRFDVCDG